MSQCLSASSRTRDHPIVPDSGPAGITDFQAVIDDYYLALDAFFKRDSSPARPPS